MSRASFTLTYDGPALRDHMMDVRDLAPALLGVGELFDAANRALNGEASSISVHVTANEAGCFSIDFQIIRNLYEAAIGFLTRQEVTAAVNLRDLIVGIGAGGYSLIWLIGKLRGRKPDRIERVQPDFVRITINKDTFDIPLKLLRLYQDVMVRSAVERIVREPLEKPGIDVVKFEEPGRRAITAQVTREEADSYSAPEIEEQTLVDEKRRAAYSIISLAFKEDNKWRLHDGNNGISATITDQEFLSRVDASAIRFSKGDVLICEVEVKQKQTSKGLKTEYVVTKVVEHRPAPTQLLFEIFEPEQDDGDKDD
jgi:hypothetical protein